MCSARYYVEEMLKLVLDEGIPIHLGFWEAQNCCAIVLTEVKVMF
jgi:hypothetical protein